MKKIREMLNRFGILVIRAIWPTKGKGGVQKMGVMILGLCALLGISKASSLQKWISGSADVKASTTLPQFAAQPATAVTAPAAADTTASETTVGGTTTSGTANIVDMVAESETIFRGQVKEVTDGFQNGIPYTEVTMTVSDPIRGQVGEEYKFRQFGLTKPRSMGNGKVYIGTTPEGWAKYAVGDDAMMFMSQRAAITGLQTTVGLGQGKVMFQGGNAISQDNNEGLFENVEVNQNLLNDKDKRLLATKKGAVNAEGFLSFVRRAVNGKWVEGGKMRHARK